MTTWFSRTPDVLRPYKVAAKTQVFICPPRLPEHLGHMVIWPLSAGQRLLYKDRSRNTAAPLGEARPLDARLR
jgi:hypothetical protein